MKRGQRLYCLDILDRIQRIEEHTSQGRDAFLQSRTQQDVAMLGFMIIGEAVKRLVQELIAAQPQVKWRDFARFRDWLIHRYHDTLPALVWEYAQ